MSPFPHDEGHAHDSDGDGVEDLPPVERTATITTAASNRPYSAFSKQTRWTVATLAGIAGVFSPISSNIFVPAIPRLAQDFNRPTSDISLAVTVSHPSATLHASALPDANLQIYLVFQAVTPSFFGAASDSYGRRPILLLTMVVYMGANIGLALMPTSAYWLLLFLRAVQSTGGSAVISIGAGAISDIAEPRERGMFMAVFQAGAMFGPAIGPLLGGIFTETLGWRAMFWFLTIWCAVIFVLVLL